VSSKEESCHTARFASVTEGATNKVDWTAVVVSGSSVGSKATSNVGDRATSR
jgi:hypothetical protein